MKVVVGCGIAVALILSAVWSNALRAQGRAQAGANEWLLHGRTEGETRFSPLARINPTDGEGPRPRVVVRHRDDSRPRGHAHRRWRRDVHERQAGACRVHDRCPHRQAIVEVGSRSAEGDRRRRPVVTWSIAGSPCASAMCTSVRSMDGWRRSTPRAARSCGRRSSRSNADLHHHRRAARREGQGDHRQRRRRVRRARLRLCL